MIQRRHLTVEPVQGPAVETSLHDSRDFDPDGLGDGLSKSKGSLNLTSRPRCFSVRDRKYLPERIRS